VKAEEHASRYATAFGKNPLAPYQSLHPFVSYLDTSFISFLDRLLRYFSVKRIGTRISDVRFLGALVLLHLRVTD